MLEYKTELLLTIVTLTILISLRIVITYFVRRFGKRKNKVAKRARLIMKYVDSILFIITFIIGILIWGIRIQDIGLIASSIFAIVGIGFFAQWSVLSHLTSGVIIFFTFPYKIGDRIKIHDNEFPIIADIEDIKAFHIKLRTDDGGLHTYPNSLVLQKGITIVSEGVKTRIVSEEQTEKVEINE